MVADASLQLGLAHHRAGREEEAARCYEAVLDANPENTDALHLLGLLDHANGRRARALEHLRRAVALRPDAATFRANLGTVCLAAGNLAEAADHFRVALHVEPHNADACANLGLTLLAAGQAGDAEPVLRQAVALAPQAADVWANLGACLHRLGRNTEAVRELRAALAIAPEHEAALASLALALQALGAAVEAEACHRTALALRPDQPATLTNLGNLLRAEGRPDDAESLLRKVVKLRPESADAWHNLGALLAGLGRLAAAEAEACCRRALALDPRHADAHYTLGTVLLLGGRMPEGFSGLEWRWRRRGFSSPRAFQVPCWDGTPLAGRTLLLHAEQGFGDTIQMLRFVPALAGDGTIVLEVPAALRRLADSCDPRVRVIEAGTPPPPFELECPLPSLPHTLRLALARIPEDVPYLHPDPVEAATWQARLAGLPGRRVGLAWAGNPAYAADARRSVPLALLAPLGHVTGVTFLSLHPGAQTPTWILDPTTELTDFAATAALAAGLDLVISVDTSAAHLAGALGRPVWLLNRFDADWRWLREGAFCPWYPTLRQFRQPAPGDWRSVIAEVAGSLAAWASAPLEAAA